MPPLHVIDVPGHTRHCVDGILYHLEAILFFIKMFGDFLDQRQVSGKNRLQGSARYPSTDPGQEPLRYLEQQVVLEDALNGLQQVGAQRQRVLQQRLPVSEELGLLLVLHALRQGCH